MTGIEKEKGWSPMDNDELLISRLAISMNLMVEQGKPVEGETIKLVDSKNQQVTDVHVNTQDEVDQLGIQNNHRI